MRTIFVGNMEWEKLDECPLFEINEQTIVRNITTKRVRNPRQNNIRFYEIPAPNSFSIQRLKAKYFPHTIQIPSLLYEEWKPVVGYEGVYEVSNKGRVKSLPVMMTNILGKESFRPPTLLSPRKRGKPGGQYLAVALYKNAKARTESVHRIVATAFLLNPNNLPCIHHKNNNPFDNAASNLQWCTVAENNSYSRIGRLVGDGHYQRRRIIVKNLEGKVLLSFTGIRELAKLTGLNRRGIGDCLNGKIKTYRGLVFEKP